MAKFKFNGSYAVANCKNEILIAGESGLNCRHMVNKANNNPERWNNTPWKLVKLDGTVEGETTSF